MAKSPPSAFTHKQRHKTLNTRENPNPGRGKHLPDTWKQFVRSYIWEEQDSDLREYHFEAAQLIQELAIEDPDIHAFVQKNISNGTPKQREHEKVQLIGKIASVASCVPAITSDDSIEAKKYAQLNHKITKSLARQFHHLREEICQSTYGISWSPEIEDKKATTIRARIEMSDEGQILTAALLAMQRDVINMHADKIKNKPAQLLAVDILHAYDADETASFKYRLNRELKRCARAEVSEAEHEEKKEKEAALHTQKNVLRDGYELLAEKLGKTPHQVRAGLSQMRSKEQKETLVLRYGLEGETPLRLSEVVKKRGVSKTITCRLLNKGFVQLQEAIDFPYQEEIDLSDGHVRGLMDTRLSGDERSVLILRYGLGKNGACYSLEAIGRTQQFKCSSESVYDIERHALEKLHRALEESQEPDVQMIAASINGNGRHRHEAEK